MADINSADRIATAIEALLDSIGTYPTALGTKTANSSTWDNDQGALAIPATTQFLHVYCGGDMWLLPTAADAAPAVAGCVYPGEAAHVIPCRGMTYLHYKNAEAADNQQIAVTAFRPT